MAESLISALIYLIVICAVAWLILWAVSKFFPEIYSPARIVVGVVVIIVILLLLLRLLPAGFATL